MRTLISQRFERGGRGYRRNMLHACCWHQIHNHTQITRRCALYANMFAVRALLLRHRIQYRSNIQMYLRRPRALTGWLARMHIFGPGRDLEYITRVGAHWLREWRTYACQPICAQSTYYARSRARITFVAHGRLRYRWYRYWWGRYCILIEWGLSGSWIWMPDIHKNASQLDQIHSSSEDDYAINICSLLFAVSLRGGIEMTTLSEEYIAFCYDCVCIC